MRCAFGWAHMTMEEFKTLNNYSCSVPTGVVVGKCWKRAKDYAKQTDNPSDWWLGRYEDIDGQIQIRWYEFDIVEDEEHKESPYVVLDRWLGETDGTEPTLTKEMRSRLYALMAEFDVLSAFKKNPEHWGFTPPTAPAVPEPEIFCDDDDDSSTPKELTVAELRRAYDIAMRDQNHFYRAYVKWWHRAKRWKRSAMTHRSIRRLNHDNFRDAEAQAAYWKERFELLTEEPYEG